eukprot:TRINITY_DN1437_c0_g2_i2.p1 TRINITY_DN1437_c0_g2~~TRINITY_DN1437_c0_g2_i2.p1  ORF type:complete len:873 (+),score=238.27 TRINITY_DN1437_c0_g2_i2:146-2764(+)
MVHTAFNAVTVIEKLPLKIEAIETWGQKLIVGTTEGVLFIYEIKSSSDGRNPFTVSLVDAQKTFSKKPINQLTVVEEYNIIISLSDGFISIHDLPSFNLRSQIARSRGCHLYTIEKTKNSLLMCAAVKKKLVIFGWDAKNNDFIETKELAIPDTARTLVWCGDSICIGFRREYNMINVSTGAMSELFPTGKGGTPIATLLPNDQILLGRDNVSIFIGFDGKPTRKYGLLWTETPTVVGYSFPYAIGLLSRFVEIRTISSSSTLVQTLQLKTPRFIAINDKTESIFVAAQNHVWKLLPVPLMNQVDQLLNEREYEEALNLCENIPDSPEKIEKLKSIKILYTYHLFFGGQYERAMEYFRELDCSPLQVIGLYPNLLPRDLRAQVTYPTEVSDLAGAALEKALVALTAYLLQLRTSLLSKPNSAEKKPATSRQVAKDDDDDYASTTDLLTIVDTSLVKAYLKVNTSDLVTFLRKPNFCHVRECEKVLSSYKKFYELVLFYQSKGMHRQALELLSKLGQGVKGGNDLYGPSETVAYLRTLGKKNLDLILEFSRWVLLGYPDDALPIFTTVRSEEESLPSVQILGHIKSLAPNLVVPYLEHIISIGRDATPDYHNELIFSYLDTVLNLKKDAAATPNPRASARMGAGNEGGQLGATRKKLLAFLEESKYYNPEKMLSRFPFDDLYEERALLLSRIDEHDKALQIYAYKLHDHQMAEKYCKKHYNPDKEEARDVYLSLFKVYLKSSEDKKELMVAPALALLNQHYQKIDVPKALELLPQNTPIEQLYNVFEAALRDNSKNRRNNQVIKNLLKSENLQIKEQMLNARSRVVKIGEDRMCPVCNKRVGLTVFACYPNGKVVHYFCMKNLNNGATPATIG